MSEERVLVDAVWMAQPAGGDGRSDPRRLRVVFIVSGFPSRDRPISGIFNLRAARGLASIVDLKIVHLRAWLPGRSWRERSEVEGTTVTTVAVPQLPIVRRLGSRATSLFNHLVFRGLGWYAVRPVLESCDLVHSVGAVSAGVLSSRWARRAKKHHITQLIGYDVNFALPTLKSARAVAGWEHHVHAVASNSRALQAHFTALYPKARNVRTIPRGVDLRVFSPVGPVLGPLSGEPPVRFLYLGGFSRRGSRLPSGVHRKGGATLLLAWESAEDALAAAGASLLLVGDRADGEDVQRWRASLRHPRRVHLLGRLAPDDVPGHVRAADVVLVPSLAEGLPNVSTEASACGRPVFGSAVDGIPEVVVDGETGLLLPPSNPEAWRDALVRFARDPGRLGEMGVRARLRMEQLFDARLYAPRMLDLYRQALQVPIEAGYR